MLVSFHNQGEGSEGNALHLILTSQFFQNLFSGSVNGMLTGFFLAVFSTAIYKYNGQCAKQASKNKPARLHYINVTVILLSLLIVVNTRKFVKLSCYLCFTCIMLILFSILL